MIVDALKYPFRAEDRAQTFGFGSTLLLVTVLLVQVGRSLQPGLFLLTFVVILGLLTALLGYLVRIMSQAKGATCEPPVLDQPKRLLIQGASAFAIILAYCLVPFGLILIEVVLSNGGATALTVGMMLFTQLLFLVEIFFLPVAITNYARTDNVRAAFEFKTIVKGATTGSYVLSGLIAFVCTMVIQVMEVVRNIIHYLSDGMGVIFLVFTLITTPIAFYLYMVMARLLSRGCVQELTADTEDL